MKSMKQTNHGSRRTKFGLFIIIVLLSLAAPTLCRAQSIQISPGPTLTLDTTTSQQFTATELDSHGVPLATQPSFIWSLASGGVGSIGDTSGLYHSGPVAGAATVKVTGGGLSATVTVTVNLTPVTVVTPASATPNPAPLTMTNLSVLGGYAGDGGETALTYTWAETSGPAAVSYSANGTHAARNTIATFTEAGDYQFSVTIASPEGTSTISSVTVTVDQSVTSIDVTPGPTLTLDSLLSLTQQFTAMAFDQFGNAMVSQPTFTWAVAAGSVGSITDAGLYNTKNVTGSATVIARSGGVSGISAVTVTHSAISPFMVYTEGTVGNESMYSQELPSGAPVNLGFPAEKNPEQPSISPDGLKIAFNDDISYDAPNRGLIWMMNADGSDTKPLAAPACGNGIACDNPSWSPDGAQLVFGSLYPGTDINLVTINADGSDEQELQEYVPSAGDPAPDHLAWSPDGSTVAFDTTDEPGIYTIPANAAGAGNLNQITNFESDAFPKWSPDGSLIGFVRRGDIYFVPSDATLATMPNRITTLGDVTDFGGFSSDGSTIYYTTYDSAPLGQIWSQNVQTGANPIQLASLAGSFDSLAVWTPPVPANPPVTLATPAVANPNPVTGLTSSLSVLGAYTGTGGESGLIYSWWEKSGPANVAFSTNYTNAAKSITATFRQAGSYTFSVYIASPAGTSTTSTVTVIVNQTLTSMTLSPGPTLELGPPLPQAQQFTATAFDQFGHTLATQPAFAWSLSSGSVGSISDIGFYATGPSGGPATVTATIGALSASVTISVIGQVTVATAAAATPNPVTGLTTNLSVLGANAGLGGADALTYTWTSTGPGPVTFSANGTNAAQNTTATFTKAGTYTFSVQIFETYFNPIGILTTSSVTVTVEQTPTSIAVLPGPPVTLGAPLPQAQQFSATALDQFGNALFQQPTFSWALGSGSVGSISNTGLYNTGTVAGTAAVKATNGGLSGSSAVTVTTAAVVPVTVATPASADPNPVDQETTVLSVLGAYAGPGGAGALTYTWSSTNPAAVTYSANGTSAASTTTATFAKAGSYTFTVTIASPAGSLTTSSVTVTVNQSAVSIQLTPGSMVYLGPLTPVRQQFTATEFDQFGNLMAPQPRFSWSTGSGSIGHVNESGLYEAATAGLGGVYVTSSSTGRPWAGSLITVYGPVTVADPAAATPNPVTNLTTSLSALGAYTGPGGAGALTYTWSSTGPAVVTYSDNGTNAARTTIATFTQAGTYTFTVNIASPVGTSTTSSVIVTVLTPPHPPVTVATAAAAAPNPVTGLTASLSVLGAYSGKRGAGALTYTWLCAGPAAVTYSDNGTNAANNTIVTFTQAGTYTFTADIASPVGTLTTSSVTVTVNQTTTSVAVSPGSTVMFWPRLPQTRQFTATAFDQFGNPIQSTATWSLASGSVGSISQAGLYTTGSVAGSATVTATFGAVSASSAVTVTGMVPPFMVYAGGTYKDGSMYTQLLPSGAPVNLGFPAGDTPAQPSISADGTQIAFNADVGYFSGNIWVMNSDGSDAPKQLTTDNASEDPSWSPDGTQLVFSKNVGVGSSLLQLFTVNADGSNEQPLTSYTTDYSAENPQWSPDGSTVAFDTSTTVDAYPSPIPGIWTIPANAAGTVAPTQVTDGSTDAFPKWSPDGRTIGFVRNNDIYFVPADATPATAPTQITTLDNIDLDFTDFGGFSSDGSTIYYYTLTFTPSDNGDYIGEIQSQDWLTGGSPVTVSKPGQFTFLTTAFLYNSFAVWTGLSAPTLTATAGASEVTLNWTASAGALVYRVYRSTAPDAEGNPALKGGLTATSYTDTAVTAGVTYYYEVTAVNAEGASPFSNEAPATPAPAPAISGDAGRLSSNAELHGRLVPRRAPASWQWLCSDDNSSVVKKSQNLPQSRLPGRSAPDWG